MKDLENSSFCEGNGDHDSHHEDDSKLDDDDSSNVGGGTGGDHDESMEAENNEDEEMEENNDGDDEQSKSNSPSKTPKVCLSTIILIEAKYNCLFQFRRTFLVVWPRGARAFGTRARPRSWPWASTCWRRRSRGTSP